jgi:hypothetical protein
MKKSPADECDAGQRLEESDLKRADLKNGT